MGLFDHALNQFDPYQGGLLGALGANSRAGIVQNYGGYRPGQQDDMPALPPGADLMNPNIYQQGPQYSQPPNDSMSAAIAPFLQNLFPPIGQANAAPVQPQQAQPQQPAAAPPMAAPMGAPQQPQSTQTSPQDGMFGGPGLSQSAMGGGVGGGVFPPGAALPPNATPTQGQAPQVVPQAANALAQAQPQPGIMDQFKSRMQNIAGILDPSQRAQFGPIGQDVLGHSQYGWIDSNKKSVTPFSASSPAAMSQMATGTPEQRLAMLPAEIQNEVKAIYEGRQSGTGRNVQQMLPYVNMVYPDFTMQDYKTKLDTQKDFTSGNSARQVKAANQAITHAEYADSLIDKLGNSEMFPGLINPVTQAFKNNMGDTKFQAARSEYNNSINALAGELTKAFRGNSGALADIEHWRQSSGQYDSPAAMHAAITSGMKLLNGSLEALGDQYNKGMKSMREPSELLSERNKPVFERLMAGQHTAPQAPQSSMTATGPNGQKIMLQGNQWVPVK